jgi:hypothetical protein
MAQRLVRLYPPGWRARFGVEFVRLLEGEALGPRVLLDVLGAAFAERLFDLSGLETASMVAYPERVVALARRPSAFIPVLMSLTAVSLVLGRIAVVGAAREPDEGAVAHLFQLLIAGEAPILGFFVLRWLRKDLRAALPILAIQAAAISGALFPVWCFGL